MLTRNNLKHFRAELFGIEAKELVEQKKMSRAERFGLPAAEKAKTDEKKRARAERFGTANGASGATAKKVQYSHKTVFILPLVKTGRHGRQHRPRKDQKANGAIRCHGRRRLKEEAARRTIRGYHCLIVSQLAATLILSLVVSILFPQSSPHHVFKKRETKDHS